MSLRLIGKRMLRRAAVSRFNGDRRSERGAALAEAALITPILFVLILGIFEFGLVYRDVLTASASARDASRLGAVIGPRPTVILNEDGEDVSVNADYLVVAGIRENMSSIPVESIDRIVVFKGFPGGAGSPVNQVPTACKVGSGAGQACNIYNPHTAFEAILAGDTGYFCGSSGPVCGWPPFDRTNGPGPGDVEYIGVYMRIERPYMTGLFGDAFTFETAHITRLEAGVFTEWD